MRLKWIVPAAAILVAGRAVAASDDGRPAGAGERVRAMPRGSGETALRPGRAWAVRTSPASGGRVLTAPAAHLRRPRSG